MAKQFDEDRATITNALDYAKLSKAFEMLGKCPQAYYWASKGLYEIEQLCDARELAEYQVL